jgi:hypothetical protein
MTVCIFAILENVHIGSFQSIFRPFQFILHELNSCFMPLLVTLYKCDSYICESVI